MDAEELLEIYAPDVRDTAGILLNNTSSFCRRNPDSWIIHTLEK